MIPYILSAVGGYLIGDSIGKQYAKGGRVEYVANDPYDQKYFRRFNDAIGSFAWIYNKKYNEGILYPLDSFDKEYYSHIQLKKDEVLLRYRTDRMVKDEKHLIKFNLDKALIYFMSDSDDDKNPKFETRGIKAEYIAISKDYAPKIMADGGETTNVELLEEGKKYFPKLKEIDGRYYLNYPKNKGSFSESGFKNHLVAYKIEKVIDSLNAKNITYSNTSQSVYFTLNGKNFRISDHKKSFDGIDITIKWNTPIEDIMQNKTLYHGSRMMAKGGKVETYAVHPQRKINVARPDGEQLYTTDYLSSFRVVGTLSEAEEQAQKFVRENEIMFPYVEIKRLHPSGNPLKSKKVSRVEKDKITKL